MLRMCWAWMPDARRLIKVMLGRDSQCVRVLIPDDDVEHRDLHDVVLVDKMEEDAPYVAGSDLLALRQLWSDLFPA